MKSAATLVLLWSLWPAAAEACESPEACLQEGVAAYKAEDYKKAAKAFDEALEGRPRDPELLVWRGRAYGRRAENASGLAKLGALSMAGKVKDSFEAAIEIDPEHVAALESLLDFYVEAPGIVGGGVEKAEPLAERLAVIDPARGHRAWATIYRKREQFEQAETALRQAVKADPEEIGHLLSLASFLSRQGRYEESDRLFAQALEREPDAPRVWFSRAKELVRAEREPEEARRLLERYLRTPLYAPDAEPYSEARDLLKRL